MSVNEWVCLSMRSCAGIEVRTGLLLGLEGPVAPLQAMQAPPKRRLPVERASADGNRGIGSICRGPPTLVKRKARRKASSRKQEIVLFALLSALLRTCVCTYGTVFKACVARTKILLRTCPFSGRCRVVSGFPSRLDRASSDDMVGRDG